jgi:hypothetical protein
VARLATVTATWTALVLVAAMPAGAAPPSLDGEIFSNNPGEGTSTITAASCNPSGTSTFSWSASGPAIGPYPGTFTESGTVTLGPQVSPSTPGQVLALSATFSIDSPAGDVTGTKALTGEPDPFVDGGVCVGPDPVLGTAQAVNIFSGVTYDAVIQTANGSRSDHGTASVNVLFQELGTFTASDFREEFHSEHPGAGAKPGRGCGDANHQHAREGECKKPPR